MIDRRQANGVLFISLTVGSRTVRLCIPVGAPWGPAPPDMCAKAYFQ